MGRTMNYLPKVFLMVALAMPLLGGTARGMVRKCSTTVNGLTIINKAPLLTIDGVVVDEALLDSDELNAVRILHMTVTCLEVEEQGVMVGRNAIAIITKEGGPAVMRSYLEDLVEAQEEHRTATGAYADNLGVL